MLVTLPGSSHECDIELSWVRAEDEGVWRCEMESYVWGLVRGYTDHRSLNHICLTPYGLQIPPYIKWVLKILIFFMHQSI